MRTHRKRYKVLVLIVCVITMCVILLKINSNSIIKVVGNSMYPYVSKDDYIFITKKSVDEIKHGDVVIFELNETYYIKRVIGFSGDTINIIKGDVYVNGVYLIEKYLGSNDSFTGNFEVPENSIFVLGDNREVSNDSRYSIGYVSYDDIIGVPVKEILK